MSAQTRTARSRAPTYGDEELQTLQRNTFRYFWQETNPSNGLIPDNTSAGGVPASIAGVGLALTSYPVGVERSFVARAQAVERTLATLRFFWNAPHGPMPDAARTRSATKRGRAIVPAPPHRTTAPSRDVWRARECVRPTGGNPGARALVELVGAVRAMGGTSARDPGDDRRARPRRRLPAGGVERAGQQHGHARRGAARIPSRALVQRRRAGAFGQHDRQPLADPEDLVASAPSR